MAENFGKADPFTQLSPDMSDEQLQEKLFELLNRLSEDPAQAAVNDFLGKADQLSNEVFAEMDDAALGEGLQALALDVVTTNLTYRSLPEGTDERELYGMLALILHEAGRRLSVYTGRTNTAPKKENNG